MKSPRYRIAAAVGLVVMGLALAGGGIYLGETDDAPGAAVIGILLLLLAVVLGVRIAQPRAK